jgi:hypothetical protein
MNIFLLLIFQDADAQVTFEDQQKINKFARNNSKLQDIKEELKAKKVFYNKIVFFHIFF